jgi:hypothetical protein
MTIFVDEECLESLERGHIGVRDGCPRDRDEFLSGIETRSEQVLS